MRGLEAIDRIRTFLLQGGLKAAIAGICVSHWSMVILILINRLYQGGVVTWLSLLSGFGSVLTALMFGIPLYFLIKFVVPKSFQTGLYDFYTGLIVGWILFFLMWWLYL